MPTIVSPQKTENKVTVTESPKIVTVSSVGTVGPQGGAGEITSVSASSSTVSVGGAATAAVTEGGTNSNKTLAFAFGVPTGATGSAGAITSATASTSAVGAGGTPTVSVTEGGSDTAKTLAFAFGAVTGATGDAGTITSVTASSSDVGAGGSSTVSVTEGGTDTNKTLAFAFGLVTGDTGKSILNGATTPSGGVDGDFWVDTSADVIYGPKASGSWPGSGVSFAVANESVTYAKIQDIPTDTFIGRTLSGTGVSTALSVSDALTMLGVEASADVTDATNVEAAGALMDSELAGIVAVKATTGTFLSADESKLDGIEANATADQTAEEIEDIVGGMLTGNTETGITVTYEDGDGTIDFAVASQTANDFTNTLKTKLDGIEASATADQTGAEIKTAYEAESNAYTDTLNTKLAGIEASATADQTAAEIRTLVGSASDSNVFTDTLNTKLAGIAAGAEVNVAHDSLTGFVANEHIDWTADYSSTAVIHAGNYTDTQPNGVAMAIALG